MGAALAVGDPHTKNTHTHTQIYISIYLTVSIYPYVYGRTSGFEKVSAALAMGDPHTKDTHTHNIYIFIYLLIYIYPSIGLAIYIDQYLYVYGRTSGFEKVGTALAKRDPHTEDTHTHIYLYLSICRSNDFHLPIHMSIHMYMSAPPAWENGRGPRRGRPTHRATIPPCLGAAPPAKAAPARQNTGGGARDWAIPGGFGLNPLHIDIGI